MIATPTERVLTVVNFFSGVGGCALGMKWAGFVSLGSFDLDAKALRGLVGLTGGPAFLCDLAAMTKAEMRRRVAVCPDCVIMSPPCKKFSDLLPAAQAAAAEYIEMAQLALAGVVLACETWDTLPAVLILENVRGIAGPRGAEILGQIVALLHRYGYTIDKSAHDCGEIGGLAQHRDRFLLVARQPEVARDFLRRPPKQRVRNVGEVLGLLPSPVSDHGDEMHQLPGCAAMTAVRLACADPNKAVSPTSKGDWRDIPDRIRCMWGPVPERIRARPAASSGKQDGKHGVESWDLPAHTVTGRGARPPSGRCSVADPRVVRHSKPAKPGSRRAKGSPDDFGVASHQRPHTTVRGTMEVQTSRASVADPHVAAPPRSKTDDQRTGPDEVNPGLPSRKGRKNGGMGVEGWAEPGHTVLGEGTRQNCRVSVADPRVGRAKLVYDFGRSPPLFVEANPRLGCQQRRGSHGVQAMDQPARTVVGHASHDNSTSSLADPRVGEAAGWEADPRRGSFGVAALDRPSPAVRAKHTPRTAPAAVVDDRGWPFPTHYLVIEDGEHVLYGPELDFTSNRPAAIVILAPDGTWHRPMTDRELACLQGFPADCQLEGPSSTRPASKPSAKHPNRPIRAAVPGRREHIGNAIPPPTAFAIGTMIAECLRSSRVATFLRPGDVWVDRAQATMEAAA